MQLISRSSRWLQDQDQTNAVRKKHHNELVLLGTSVSGMETCIEIPSLNIGFDIGLCTQTSVHLDHVAISHGHVDHIGAIVLHACRRQLLGISPAHYYVPSDIMSAVEDMFYAAEAMDGSEIARIVTPMGVGDVVSLSSGKVLEAFSTYHKVPSLGYRVGEVRKRLKREFQSAPPGSLSDLAGRGIQLNETYFHYPVAYTGDTRIETIEKHHDFLKDVTTLITELTFVGNDVAVETARSRGHTHLDEVLPRADLFCNPEVVFTHFSARYDIPYVRRICEDRLPEDLKSRTCYL